MQYIFHKEVSSWTPHLQRPLTLRSPQSMEGWSLDIKWCRLGTPLLSNCCRFSCESKEMFFQAFWVGKCAVRRRAFPIFHYQGQMPHSPQSPEILVIPCHCHVPADGWRSGLKGLAWREGQGRPPLWGPCTSALPHSFPQGWGILPHSSAMDKEQIHLVLTGTHWKL